MPGNQGEKTITEKRGVDSVKSSRSFVIWIGIFVAGFLTGVVFSAWKLDRTAPPPLTTPMAREDSAQRPDPRSRLAGLEKMLAADPQNVQAAIQVGNEYFDAGQFQNAVDAYQRALKLDARNADVLTDMATGYRKLGKTGECVAALRQALEVDPNHALALFNLGVVLRDDAKDDAGALKVWEQFLEKAGDSPHAVMVKPWVGQLKQKLGGPSTGTGK
jgi:cytochrome c-type biogenesis protein CcmH/NrfG